MLDLFFFWNNSEAFSVVSILGSSKSMHLRQLSCRRKAACDWYICTVNRIIAYVWLPGLLSSLRAVTSWSSFVLVVKQWIRFKDSLQMGNWWAILTHKVHHRKCAKELIDCPVSIVSWGYLVFHFNTLLGNMKAFPLSNPCWSLFWEHYLSFIMCTTQGNT